MPDTLSICRLEDVKTTHPHPEDQAVSSLPHTLSDARCSEAEWYYQTMLFVSLNLSFQKHFEDNAFLLHLANFKLIEGRASKIQGKLTKE